MKKIFLLALAVFISVEIAEAKPKPIKTLIVTGQNNHNWKVSHIAIKKILENSELFCVDIAVSPEQGQDMSGFNPVFCDYQLVVLDYNGDRWNENTDAAFLDYVNKGGGVVIYHAADNAFPDWEEFNKIIALGGWGGRDEKSGPYVYLDKGEVVRDIRRGYGGAHGAMTEFVMNSYYKTKHPILKGLPEKWKHATDELYCSMRGPGNIKDILYSAYSDPSTGGSGREEILLFTVNYAKARIFHTMLGHAGVSLEDNKAMQCAGFQVTLLRGAEWAARGKVTQKIPEDFPTSYNTSFRNEYK